MVKMFSFVPQPFEQFLVCRYNANLIFVIQRYGKLNMTCYPPPPPFFFKKKRFKHIAFRKIRKQHLTVNPLSANLTKSLSVFDYFVGLALEGLY